MGDGRGDTEYYIEQKEKEIKRLKQEKKELIEQEEIKNKKAVELSIQLEKLKAIRDGTNKAIFETTLELNKHCTHDKIRTEERNYEGGYLDRSEHWTDYYCEVCGAKVNEEVTYGGFA